MNINAGIKRCYVIGTSVEKYSLSPGMHRIIYNELGLTDWEYNAKNILNENELREFCEEARNKNYIGFNVTVPYKESVIKYLDSVDAVASTIGAVNTVINRDSELTGYNTDSVGFLNDLEDSLSFKGGDSALVIGAGGAGRAVVAGLLDRKIINSIYLYDIDDSKIQAMLNDFMSFSSNLERIFKIDDKINEVDLLVNATPMGMNAGEPALLTFKGKVCKKNLKIYDLVYNRKTELLTEAEESGLLSCGGLGMLAGQGLEAFKLWAGRDDVSGEILKKMKEYLKKEVYRND